MNSINLNFVVNLPFYVMIY